MNHKSAITQLEEQWLRIEKLVQDNRAIQLELEQERHFVNGILRVRKVLRRKYHAEKARADAAEERERILKRAICELIK
ncbi:hypothetical protein ERICIV_00875 [Paenibacillus larvae subsp. larvae]|uniref:Uncharacterized protein n=1 Tax=Paenibacillus larvae subsp. larvae TaxID=147375 RepID=A0A2L1TWM1_9BACL|nr:hypothetical protein [Paenibacillus larvae]AQT85677.1 hypothetical protein B1222_16720 [Paenibacillus larvae subsp. pulvifaciens]AVF25079.1 hypothetical protein ERICIII_00872 [Paenibacillus larvae subsp. larvae]AVF29843.1 hypothetical protein ERICIV_00875 [Paenibacillus larvae subsp. larvae]MBH0341218.1 hypothetical protein [Paenibacillus larvae]MCY9503147.1 hypothetical protein [Paenibacillus larvae]